MYLLKIDIESETLLIILIAAIIYILITIWIIQIGVKRGTKQTENYLLHLVNLKVLEMKKSGIDREELRQYGGYYDRLKAITKKGDYMGASELKNEKDKLEEIYS